MGNIIHVRTVILLVLGITLLFRALISLKQHRLHERYALIMLFTGLPFIILAFWPDGIVFLSNLLSIEKPTLMILCLGVFVILILFKLLSIVSVQQRQITTLCQMMSIKQVDQAKQTQPRNAS